VRFDLRWSIAGGLALCALGTLWLASGVTTTSDLGTFVAPLLVIGAGSAFVYSPLLVATMRAVAPDAGAKAASFIVLAFQLGGSISSALIVTLVDQRAQYHQTMLASQITLANPAVADFLQHGTRAQLAAVVDAQASALSYADAFVASGIVALLAMPSALLLARKRI